MCCSAACPHAFSVALIPLLVTASTAFLYRFSLVFGQERADVRWLIGVHQGSFFGISPVLYTLVNAFITLLLAWTGYRLLKPLYVAHKASVVSCRV